MKTKRCLYPQPNSLTPWTAIGREQKQFVKIAFAVHLSAGITAERYRSDSGALKSAVLHFVFFMILINKMQQSAAQRCLGTFELRVLPFGKTSEIEFLNLLNSPTDRTFGNRWSRYKELGKKVPLEYTPYGELWTYKSKTAMLFLTMYNNFLAKQPAGLIEEVAAGLDKLPFRFTGKELDEETGLYYYGARYLDPKYSRWLSGDPALGEYIPQAPVNDEAKKHNENLPGMGGVFNVVNLHVYHYAGYSQRSFELYNPVKYVDPDGRMPWLAIPIIIGFTLLLQSNSQPLQRQGLPYEPDKWNSNLDIMVRTNCYAYAMNFQKNPVTGKSFPKRGEGGFALQPGDLFGYKLKDLQPSTIEFLVSLDCIKINYTFKETTFEKSVKKGNWKIALVIRSDDYHWYRQNKDGSWSHKQGSTPVKDTDDAGNKIFDPREAKSSYKFVKFYEVGPND